jgi:hypothetical protein
VGVATLPPAEFSTGGRGVETALHAAKIKPRTILVTGTILLGSIASSFRRHMNQNRFIHEPVLKMPKLIIFDNQGVTTIAPIGLTDDEIALRIIW